MKQRLKHAPRARLVCVGSELLAGQVNTHQAWLSVRLARAGFTVAGESSVPDDIASIETSLLAAFKAAELVVVCGGLGPTFDDLTREAAASALRRPLLFKPRLWMKILKRFARYHVPIPEENKRQAFILAGAEVLANNAGSAPGQLLEFRGRDGRACSLLLLPGPYSEMAPMFERLLPRLASRHTRGIHVASLSVRLADVSESVADERLDCVRARFPEARFTILASGGEVSFHATVTAPSSLAARRARSKLRREIRKAVGPWAYGEGDITLEAALGARLKKRGLTLAVAESCTGGLLASRITSVPGASAWFAGGVIAYSNAVKVSRLGVRPSILKRHGAVSAQCAAAMADGARKATGAPIGVSITGIAGPDGGTKEKPIGLVFVAVRGPGAALDVRRLDLHGPREAIRARAATAALVLAKDVLDGLVEVS